MYRWELDSPADQEFADLNPAVQALLAAFLDAVVIVDPVQYQRRRVSAGEWEPGERLPAVAELAQHYGVARNTVIKALRRLAEGGLIEIVPNWGTFRTGN